MYFNELFDRNLITCNSNPHCNGRLVDLCFANFPDIIVNRSPPTKGSVSSTTSSDHYGFNTTNILRRKSHLSHTMVDFSAVNIETLLSPITY